MQSFCQVKMKKNCTFSMCSAGALTHAWGSGKISCCFVLTTVQLSLVALVLLLPLPQLPLDPFYYLQPCIRCLCQAKDKSSQHWQTSTESLRIDYWGHQQIHLRPFLGDTAVLSRNIRKKYNWMSLHHAFEHWSFSVHRRVKPYLLFPRGSHIQMIWSR